MAKPAILIRNCVLSRPSRRHVGSTSSRRTSTSPQRYNVAAPALQTAAKPFADIPGPIALPMLRHAAHVLPRIGCFHHTVGLGLLEGLRDKYGDLVRLAKASRKRPVLYVFDPDMMREVYESDVTAPPAWDTSPLGQQRKIVGAQCPMHTDESKAIWAAIRALLKDGSLLQSYEKAFDEIAADLTRRLGQLRHAENALNEELGTEIHRWALETLGLMVFGVRLGCLDGPVHVPTDDNRKPEMTSMDDHIPELCSLSKRSLEELSAAERLVRCSLEIADHSYLVRSEQTLKTDTPTFNSALKAFDRHFRCVKTHFDDMVDFGLTFSLRDATFAQYWAIMVYYTIKNRNFLAPCCDDIPVYIAISLTELFLSRAMEAMNSGDLRPEQVLLDKLRPLGRRVLPLAADILLAGVDPLVQTALSMFHQLSLHAARQQRAHDEVAWSVASKEAGARCPELPYIAACASEAMRLHPVTGGVVRRSRESLVVAGYEIPAGVDIVLAHGVTSKSEKQWGRPKSFIPERWCAEGWEPLRASWAHPMASQPFGEACPATGIAGVMLATLATRVLDKYRLEWHGPAPNVVTTGLNKLQPPFYFVLQNAG